MVFGDKITSAIFWHISTCFNFNPTLIRYVSMTVPSLGGFFGISAVMESNPGAFLGFRLLLISSATSFQVTSVIHLILCGNKAVKYLRNQVCFLLVISVPKYVMSFHRWNSSYGSCDFAGCFSD